MRSRSDSSLGYAITRRSAPVSVRSPAITAYFKESTTSFTTASSVTQARIRYTLRSSNRRSKPALRSNIDIECGHGGWCAIVSGRRTSKTNEVTTAHGQSVHRKTSAQCNSCTNKTMAPRGRQKGPIRRSSARCKVRTCRSEATPVLLAIVKAILRVASNYLVGGGDFCIATSSPLGVTAFTDACLICAAFDACSSGIESTGLPACIASCLARVFG